MRPALTPDQKIAAIISWADDNEWFDTKFVDSLFDRLERCGHLTERQVAALDNLIDRCDIDVEAYL